MGAKLCIYIYIYINVHICIVTVALQIIFYFFSLSFTSLSLFLSSASTLTSLFLSLVPHSQLTNLWSKLTITNRHRSKLTHRLPPKQAHLPISFRIFWLISGFWGFDLFNSLFHQFWDFLVDQWVLGFWSLFILCLISGWWWVDDDGLMMVADADAWWWWVDDDGWVGWWWVWIDRCWWLVLWWVCERVLERSVKMNILLNKCVE